MKVHIEGTVDELSQLYEWGVLNELIRVDYYKRSMVSDAETFAITEADLERVGLIQKPNTAAEASDESDS